MSKLNTKMVLDESLITTKGCGVNLKMSSPDRNGFIEVQFGHSTGPTAQIARAPDLRELAQIFLEAAELLEPSPDAEYLSKIFAELEKLLK